MENKPTAPVDGAAIAEAHDPANHEGPHRGDWRVGALASVALTAGANFALGLPHLEHIEVPGTSGHGAPQEAPLPAHLLPGANASGDEQTMQTEVQQKDVLQVAEERWARLFSADKHAGELLQFSQLHEVTAQIEALRAAGRRDAGRALVRRG